MSAVFPHTFSLMSPCSSHPPMDRCRWHGLGMRMGFHQLLTAWIVVGFFAIALVALGITDLIFALDSIPAILGLTTSSYVVITANIFALMGLRQLYFLLQGLMDRLIHLSRGLAFILAFIGVKMVLHALHSVGAHVPEISLELSLAVIITTLTVTAITSLYATRGGSGKAKI